MKKFLFEDLGKKYSIAQLVKMEDELKVLDSLVHMRQQIIEISNIRDEAVAYWNDHTPKQRANFGKSEDEIKNGHNAKKHAVIDFECVSKLDFEDLPEFWQAIWLSGTVDFYKLKNTPESARTQKKMEAQS